MRTKTLVTATGKSLKPPASRGTPPGITNPRNRTSHQTFIEAAGGVCKRLPTWVPSTSDGDEGKHRPGIPVARAGDAREVAATVPFLCGPEAPGMSTARPGPSTEACSPWGRWSDRTWRAGTGDAPEPVPQRCTRPQFPAWATWGRWPRKTAAPTSRIATDRASPACTPSAESEATPESTGPID